MTEQYKRDYVEPSHGGCRNCVHSYHPWADDTSAIYCTRGLEKSRIDCSNPANWPAYTSDRAVEPTGKCRDYKHNKTKRGALI